MDAVDRAGILSFRGMKSFQPARHGRSALEKHMALFSPARFALAMWLALGSIVCVAAWPAAVAGEKDQLVHVIGSEIHRPLPSLVDWDDSYYRRRKPVDVGTSVYLLAIQHNRCILSVDPDACKLVSLIDDQGTDLAPKDTKVKFTGEAFTKDGSMCRVRLFVPRLPHAKANKLTMKATLVLHCGKDEKMAEWKGAIAENLVGELKAKAGPIKLVFTRETRPFGKYVLAAVGWTFPNLPRSVTFSKANGEEIKPSPGGGTITLDEPTEATHPLPWEVQGLSVSVRYFANSERIEIPVAVSFGLGL